ETAIMATYTYQGTLNEDDLGELIPQEPSVINPYAAFGTSVSIYHLLGSDSYLSIAVKDGESIALYELDMATAMELLRDRGFADLEFIAGVNDPTKAYFSNGNQVYDLTESEIQAVRSALKSMTSSYSVRLGSLNGGEWTLAFEEDVDRLECQYYPAKDLIKVGQSIFFDELGTIKALLASKAA
ncbi:MAG: hypothetical protein K6F32_05725, partial [Bacilli bacterium]|nr:hypothetical protein [Bacilli bacterium]